MPIVAKGSEYKFFPIPAGTHQAVCYGVWDIGRQKSGYFDKNENEVIQHKVVIAWELNELMKEGDYEGKRFVILKEYSLSLGEKANLTKDLTSWRGVPFTDEEKKGFDIEKLVGVNCVLGIVHGKKKNGDDKNVISAIMKCPKGMPSLNPENPSNKMPKWVEEKAKNAVPDTDVLTEEIQPETNVHEDEETIAF